MKKKYYAYFLEDTNTPSSGIVDNWETCKQIVDGKKARYKSFSSYEEAEEWLIAGAKYNYQKKTCSEVKKLENDIILEDAIYFDSGTGRGRGVEVRVSDKNGKSLLNESEYAKKLFINEFDNLELGNGYTNNFGELFAFYLAIEIAMKLNYKKIIGDSQLVIYYWTIGKYHSEKLNKKTVELIEKSITKRRYFETNGGKISFIKGEFNPADLGFHK